MSTTWSQSNASAWKAVNTTGTEAAPSAATDGADLAFLSGGFTVFAEADNAQTFTASPGGTLQAYLYDDVVGAWARCPDLDLAISVASQRRQAFSGFNVYSPRGRVAYAPASVTLSGGGVTVYVQGSRR
jgi:hypothetical protein